jgi:hypothetical protein
MKGSGSRFLSALIGIGVEPPKYVDGICLRKGEYVNGIRQRV